jgi:uncharacterized protein involved in exopolysaccharide biosynthesis/Mrp family chromosome partitioning ATPase
MPPQGEQTAPPRRLEPDPWELAAFVAAVRRHLRRSLAIMLGWLVLAVLSLLLPRFYTADATMAYVPQTPLIRGGGDLPMTDPLRDGEIDAQLALVASLPVAEDVARAVDLGANPRLQDEADTVAAHSDRPLSRTEALGTALLDHVKARRVGQTPEFTISFTAGTADQAARIANLFAASYLKAAVQQKSALADASARQLDTRVAQLRQQATQAESDLARFRLANNLLDSPDSTALDQEVAALQGQLADAQGQAALAGTRSAQAGAAVVVGGGNGGSVDTTPVSALTEQRAAGAADLAALLGRHGEKHPDVIAARKKLAEIDAQLALAMQGNGNSAAAEARGAAARAQALAVSLTAAQARLAASLSHDARLADLQNSALAGRQAYQDGLKISADQTALRALIQPDAQQIGIAVPPLRPKFPRLGINLLVGLALGLVTAVVVAFIRESWRHTLGSVGDIGRWLETDYFAPLPMLAAARKSSGCGDPGEVVLRDPRCAFAESCRSLGTAALFVAGKSTAAGGRVIGVTAARAGEGTTTASLAMGRVLAAAGTTVALIAARGDGDAAPGLRQTDRSGLTLVASGLAGTAPATFDAGQMVQTIAALRREFAVVIIDIPPILAGGAHGELLQCLDALVLLARWRATPVRAVREAIHRIAVAGGHVSGVALSMVQGAGS